MVPDPDIPQRIARLTPLADVLARIEALVKPVEPRRAGLAEALGATLADGVVIDAAIPSVARALRDGWAVASELTADAGAYVPVSLPSATRIEVGERLPSGADAVARLDAVTVRNGAALMSAPVAPGEGVLPAGADAAGGATLPAGRRLGRLQIALLAAAGVAGVRIRAPRLRLARARPVDDLMIDAALDCIADAIEAAGGKALRGEVKGGLAPALTDGEADAVVVVGGTGSGRNDASIRTLAAVGEVVVHGVALVPAESTAFGRVGARPVLALPGRVDAALAAWHMLGRRVLARLAASLEAEDARTAKLTHKVTSSVGLAELVPVRCLGDVAQPIASGYVPLTALAEANGWIFVKPESEGYPAHSEVVIRPWP